jgi:hypothetical protein
MVSSTFSVARKVTQTVRLPSQTIINLVLGCSTVVIVEAHIDQLSAAAQQNVTY